jgi:outer membrane protein
MRKLFMPIIIAAVALAAGLAGSARAQKQQAPVAQAPVPPPITTVSNGLVKIGFINVHRAVTESDKGKAAIDHLQSEVDQSKAKLDVKKKEIENLQAEFKASADKWDLATKQAKQSEIESKAKAINREAEDYEEYYQKRESDLLKPIIESLNQVITDLGKKDGYTVIFDVTGAVLYINPSVDLTDKVIKNFNTKK